MSDSRDTTQGPFEWTVAALSIFGKSRHLVPPCSHLPTFKHYSKATLHNETVHRNLSEARHRVHAQRGTPKASEAAVKANNHIWKSWNKETQDE